MDGSACQRLGLVMLLALCLGGCFQADLTLRFDHHTRGQLTQSIYLGERGTALASASLAPWLESRRRQVSRLGGALQEDTKAVQLTVPFTTGSDLVARFQQVFADQSPEAGAASTKSQLIIPGLGPIPFNLQIEQQNWGLASRTHLIYDINLQHLPMVDEVLPGQPANPSTLSFRLQTPWGIRQVRPGSALPTNRLPAKATWQLQPGQLNHIDVLFWLPNAVGLGTVAIVSLVLLGYILRYRLLSPPGRAS